MEAADGGASPAVRLTKAFLRGHKDSVTCLASEHPRPRLCSGSADGTCRLWDLRAGRTSVRAALAGAEVTSVAFSPVEEHMLIAATGLDVLGFDLRSDRVILQEPARRAAGVAEEEINQVAAAGWGTSVLVAEDSGAVHMLDTRSWACEGTLAASLGDDEEEEEEAVEALDEEGDQEEEEQGDDDDGDDRGGVGHTSICSCVASRPGHDLDFASGGLDAAVILWRRDADSDGACEGRKVQMLPDVDEGSATSTGGCQLLNPPFVHSTSYRPDGLTLAAGLGDGTVAVLDADSGDQLQRLRGGHAAAVAQVLYSPAGLFSAGNDLGICLWGASAPRLRLTHSEKVNWLAWSGATLVVAGIGCDVAAYEGFDR